MNSEQFRGVIFAEFGTYFGTRFVPEGDFRHEAITVHKCGAFTQFTLHL